MDHLTALKVFRHAVDHGSFAGAARHLGLSPAAVSKNIGELEAHLSVRLLNRTTRRMSLTEAGALYYERVVGVLQDLAEADSSLSAMRDVPSGQLRVSAPTTLTLTYLSPIIPKFLARYPELSLYLRTDDRWINIVEEGFDVAIRVSDSLEDSSLIARKLMDISHVVCGAPAYFERRGTPQTPDELQRHPCIQFTLTGHVDHWEFTKAGHVVSLPVNARYKVTSSLAARDAVRAGLGLSMIPWGYVKEDIEQGRLCTVLDDWSKGDAAVYAVYPSRRHVVAKVRAFLDFVTEELSEDRHGAMADGSNSPVASASA